MAEKLCLDCGKPVKYSDYCKSCSVKRGKKKYPLDYNNPNNELCSFGCEQVAKYKFLSGSICCSKGHQYCPSVRNKNSEATKGKPSGMLGKTHSIETKKILSIESSTRIRIKKERSLCACGCGQKTNSVSEGYYLPFHKPKITISEERRLEIRKNMSLARKNSVKLKEILSSKEYKDKMSIAKSGSKNGNYKGLDGKWASYDTSFKHLEFCEELRRDPENENILNCRCTYCGKWYRPGHTEVQNRLMGVDSGSCRFYCSDGCKTSCDIYGQIKYPKGHNKDEVDPTLRKMRFELDNYTCQKCGQVGGSLACHHIDPVNIIPMFANDIDSVITMCKECHHIIHTQINGCRYHEIRDCEPQKY